MFVPGVANFDASDGSWISTVDLLNAADEPMVEVSEQSFFLLEVPMPLKSDDDDSVPGQLSKAERSLSSQQQRTLGWWLHVDRHLEASIAVMSRTPQLFTNLNIFHSNFSIGSDGSLQVPTAASVLSWLKPLQTALPKACINLVLGGGHSHGPSAAFKAAAGNEQFALTVVKHLQQYNLSGVNLDWENGHNASDIIVMTSVIASLSHTLAPHNKTVSLCVASGWLPYLDASAWPAYVAAGVNRLMTMSTYPLTQPFSMQFEQHVLAQMLHTIHDRRIIGVGLWPKPGRGWTEARLRTFLSNVTISGVTNLDIFCADLLASSPPPPKYWTQVLQEWVSTPEELVYPSPS